MKKILILSFSLVLAFPAMAQTMRDAFLAMPDSIMPSMTKNNRMDLVDFNASHMTSRITSRLSADIYLDSLSDGYLKLREASHEVEMGMLPAGDTLKVIAVVDRVLSPAVDSRVRLYCLSGWSRYSGRGFFAEGQPGLHSLKARDFLKEPVDSLSEKQVVLLRTLENMTLLDASLDMNDRCLVISPSLGILNREDREMASAMFEKKRYFWMPE